MSDLIHFISGFWVIFSFSFVVALSGAMAPGPLLTYTIIKSARGGNRGYLMGLWIITGHAVLEIGIIVFLLMGFSFLLQNIYIVRVIGLIGGCILVYFGVSVIRDAYLGKIPTDFLRSTKNNDETSTQKKEKTIDNPVLGGIMISMANPYWWVWWATIGAAFMIQFEVSFYQWRNLIAFFLGHEAGDLAWYMLVSVLSFFGLRRLNPKTYYVILTACSIFMIIFGIYLGVSPFYKTAF